MKKKSLVFTLVATLFILFSVGSANATWMSGATVDWVGVTADGDYSFTATVDGWSKTYTILSSSANANAMLAVILTAQSNGAPVSLNFTLSTLHSVFAISQ